jgi:hypothetical protein
MKKPIDLRTNYGRNKFYSSPEWRLLRRVKLVDEPFFEECLKDNRNTLATEVHHKIEVAEAPQHCLDLTNLVSLCKPCHSLITFKAHLGGEYARSQKFEVVNNKWKENLLSIEFLKNQHNFLNRKKKEVFE